MNFLESYDLIPIPINIPLENLNQGELFLGKGKQGLEICVFKSQKKQTSNFIQNIYKKRRKGRAAPVLIVLINNQNISLCGTNGDQPQIYEVKDFNQVERLCISALNKPDRNSAINFLKDAIPSLETKLPGIHNEGFLSMHELEFGLKSRKDWDEALAKGKPIIKSRDHNILINLGFKTKRLDNLTELLISNEQKTGIAILLREDEMPNIGTSRFNNISPITYALNKADYESLSWVIIIQGDKIRLYNSKNIGVSKRGRTESFIECQLSLISSEDVGIVWLLFSSDALKKSGTINSILESSSRFAADIAYQLRERIYEIIIPKLTEGITEARNISNPTKQDISITYEMSLILLFRLLFIAYAEDRDLLPFKSNSSYKQRSLKHKAIELSEKLSSDISEPEGENHWYETSLLWKAISVGNKEWGIPAYGGEIFSSNSEISNAGYEIEKIKLKNKIFEPVLIALLLTKSKEKDYAPLDFRALSVREFGTIYEGLLESELSIAENDLGIDEKGSYLPTTNQEKIKVYKGEIFLHDRSGARKTSGSFYTPDFAVEHLLEGSLEPAIDNHLKRMENLSDADVTEQFFDFHIADISMGSGHFLVAAIDCIERRFSNWLNIKPNPGIIRELQFLRHTAKNQLDGYGEYMELEDSQILRRMIAKRCIYGIDINPLTVQLAKLSIWIHTFVPGLPLSLLDHNLINGNSLIGVDSLKQIKEKFKQSEGSLFQIDANKIISEAAEPLRRLAKLSDSNLKDIEEGRALIKEANFKINQTKALCDLITAKPVSNHDDLKNFLVEDWENLKENILNSDALKIAHKILKPLSPVHFPIVFPEVFLGYAEGFNVVIGNPPWEKVHVREDEFLGRFLPGAKGLPQREREIAYKDLMNKRPELKTELKKEIEKVKTIANILIKGPYPGISSSHIDLFKAFVWRFWSITSFKFGFIGAVLPRSVIAAKGSEVFRKELFKSSTSLEIVSLQNKGRWIFDMEPRYTILLTTISKGETFKEGIFVKGPYSSMQEFTSGLSSKMPSFSSNEVLSWNEEATLPQLRSSKDIEVFRQIRLAKDLCNDHKDEWLAKPVQGDFNSTTGKPFFDLKSKSCPFGFWKVYKGSSFDIWDNDTGEYYAWFDKEKYLNKLENKYKLSQYKTENFKTLPFERPRIVFRKVTRGNDTRTMRAALAPPNTIHTDASQFVFFPRGNEKDESYLLGILSSIPLDWYARRFIEVNFNFFIFNRLPIPRPKNSNPLWKRIVELSGQLACTDERYLEWSKAVGINFKKLDVVDKEDKISEIDALVSILYSLNESQVKHIFSTFHEGWEFESRLKNVLRHYDSWSKRIY